jgi:hypothetical protein
LDEVESRAVSHKHSARGSIRLAELAALEGLQQARAVTIGQYGVPYKQTKLDEIIAWRDAHR